MDQQPSFVCPSHTTHYIIILIAGIMVGAGASFAYLKQVATSEGNTYQAGFNAARKLAEDSAVGGIFRAPDDVRTISGTVTAITNNRVSVHVESQNPFADPNLADRTIVINTDTKITKNIPGDIKAFQAEMEDFIEASQTDLKTPVAPPRPPQAKSVTVDTESIAVGDAITVTTSENIKDRKEFSASEIEIQ